MALDILLVLGFFDHPKTRALHRRLGADGVLSLLRLWCWARAERPAGDLTELDTTDVERAAGWPGATGHFVTALLIAPPGESTGFLERTDAGVLRLRNWGARQPWAVNYARSSTLKQKRREAGKRGGLISAQRRKELGLLTNDARDDSGRFSSKTAPAPQATPQATPQAHGKQTSASTDDVTHEPAVPPPKQTEALRDPVSGDQRGSPPRKQIPPTAEPAADEPANLAAARVLRDHLGGTERPGDCLTVVAELLLAGTTTDAIRREIPRLDQALGVWAAKRALEEALGVGRGRPDRDFRGPATPDTGDATVRRLAEDARKAAADHAAFRDSGYPTRTEYLRDRDAGRLRIPYTPAPPQEPATPVLP